VRVKISLPSLLFNDLLGFFMSTYRIYARWAEQKVTDKTVTESKAVADFAWEELRRLSWNGEVKPIGLTYTCNGKQVDYIDLTPGVG
jgi:hypothetical protein